MKNFKTILILFTLLAGFSCHQPNEGKNGQGAAGADSIPDQIALQEKAMAQPGPPVIIYKTREDYSKNVPVILTMDRKNIASYPGIKDLKIKGEYAYPTPLKEGYLLDRKGISDRVAFLDITYEEYSKLKKTPSREELKSMILDDDPLEVMYFCGSRNSFRNVEEEVNMVIESGDLSVWSKMK